MPTESKYKFTPSSLAAIYCSNFVGSEFSSAERRAGARAILGHRKHVDNEHVATRKAGGLHPIYIALHGQNTGNHQEQGEIKQVVDESLNDLFDVVSSCYF
jgi:hypothetical protein